MIFQKPKFWDFKKPNYIAYLLSPLIIFTKINILISNLFIKKKFKGIKTICVGNIYLGGTGKTPTTLSLYRIIKKINLKVVTAKKYYFNQADEQTFLSKKSDFITLKSRVKIIQEAIKKSYELIVFDDGLQEKHIDYDIKFVCFDARKFVGNGYLIPSGPLRENINSLKKYDGLFLKNIKNNFNSNEINSEIKKINSRIQIFNSYVFITNIDKFNLDDKYLIFSGIGNSESFRDMLIENNFNIIEEIIYPDHYKYTYKDFEKIMNIARAKNLKIITTEKDYSKVPEPLKEKINFIEIDLKIENENKLVKFIKSRLNETD